MKTLKYSALFTILTLGLSVGLFAKDKNEGKFSVYDSVQVGSTQLKAGDYKAVWDTTGPDVQVKILQGKNVLATVPAKLVDESSARDSVTLSDPGKLVYQIHFGSLHKSLVFGAETASGEAATSAQN
jgi:hypothetical protein